MARCGRWKPCMTRKATRTRRRNQEGCCFSFAELCEIAMRSRSFLIDRQLQIALLVLICSTILLISQQFWSWIWPPHQILVDGQTILETVGTWDWSLTLLILISQSLFVCRMCNCTWFTSGLWLLCGLLALYYLVAVCASAGTGSAMISELTGNAPYPHGSRIVLPTKEWHHHKVYRQLKLDASFGWAVANGILTILAGASRIYLCIINRNVTNQYDRAIDDYTEPA